MSKVSHLELAGGDWRIHQNDNGTYNIDQVHLSLLMDLRDELRTLRSILRGVLANTTKKKRRKKSAC